MIDGAALADALSAAGCRIVSGVPCSHLAGLIRALEDDPRFRYVPAANEGAALAIAAGAWLGGGTPAVLLQNSGLGNLVNPLASLSAPYRIPALLLVSMRAHPDPERDEPQHRVMGARTAAILDALGVRHAPLPAEPEALGDAFALALDELAARRSFAFLVEAGTVAGCAPPAAGDDPSLSRLEAIRVVAAHLSDREAVVATTGLAGRELMSVSERSANFAMAGSMGHAVAIGLGIAIGQPERRVVVLDGDGALLMHAGSLSTVGHERPPNLVHVVLDNGTYDSTGGQRTTSANTDLVVMALACGYRAAHNCRDADELGTVFARALSEPGPVFIRAAIGAAPGPPAPRVTARGSLDSQAAAFRAALAAGR